MIHVERRFFMAKKEELMQLSDHELLCNLVYAQRQTRNLALMTCGAIWALTLAVIVGIVVIVPKLNGMVQSIDLMIKPLGDTVQKLSEIDVEQFNEAVHAFSNFIKNIPFFGG